MFGIVINVGQTYKEGNAKRNLREIIMKFKNICEDVWWWIRYGIWQRMAEFPRYMYWFFQRGKRGYSDSDVWGFCDHLSDIIIGGVKQLHKNHQSYPSDLTTQQWNKVLKEVIWTFETAKHICNHDWLYQNSESWNKKDYNKWVKLSNEVNLKYPTLEKCKAMTKYECEKFEMGWELFQKHYFSLWD